MTINTDNIAIPPPVVIREDRISWCDGGRTGFISGPWSADKTRSQCPPARWERTREPQPAQNKVRVRPTSGCLAGLIFSLDGR